MKKQYCKGFIIQQRNEDALKSIFINNADNTRWGKTVKVNNRCVGVLQSSSTSSILMLSILFRYGFILSITAILYAV